MEFNIEKEYTTKDKKGVKLDMNYLRNVEKSNINKVKDNAMQHTH